MNFEMRVMNEHMDDDVDHIREPVLGMEFEEEKTQVCRFAKKGIRRTPIPKSSWRKE
jgi:hypothetical protein